MPKYGQKKPLSWTSENVVDHCSAFYPSPYSDTHMFVLIKVGLAIHMYIIFKLLHVMQVMIDKIS